MRLFLTGVFLLVFSATAWAESPGLIDRKAFCNIYGPLGQETINAVRDMLPHTQELATHSDKDVAAHGKAILGHQTQAAKMIAAQVTAVAWFCNGVTN